MSSHMTRQTGARFIARGNGQRPLDNHEPPSSARWAEAISILATGLSTIAKLGGDAGSVAIATLSRAGESVVQQTTNHVAHPIIDEHLLNELRMTRAAIDELKSIPAPAHLLPAPAIVEIPVKPGEMYGEAYFIARIRALEEKRRLAQMRGDSARARTTSTQLTSARKRLRELQALRAASKPGPKE
jgi:hypothetical protein